MNLNGGVSSLKVGKIWKRNLFLLCIVQNADRKSENEYTSKAEF